MPLIDTHQVPAQRAAEGGTYAPHLRQPQWRGTGIDMKRLSHHLWWLQLVPYMQQLQGSSRPIMALHTTANQQSGPPKPSRVRTSCSSSGPEGAGASKHLV